MTDLSHEAVYLEHELHLGPVETCRTCNLAFPKPPARIRDPKLMERFKATRPWCQVCHGTYRVQAHHMGDVDGVHRRSDVFENLTALCAHCHIDKFHSTGGGLNRESLRPLKDLDEQRYREQYAQLEENYDGDVLWAVAA